MPRPLRPIADGLIYHVINRGNNRQDVFHNADDFTAFLTALADLKQRQPFELFGYCLMSNHFHLLIRSRRTSISLIVQSLLISHTHRYHKQNQSAGHIWQGRFKSPVVQEGEHLMRVLRYIESNPLRARVVKRAENYPWSSYRVHGLGVADELVDPLDSYEQISRLPKTRHSKWSQRVHQPPDGPELDAIRRSVTSGLPYGDDAWIKRLSRRLKLDLTIRPRGRPRKSASSPKK